MSWLLVEEGSREEEKVGVALLIELAAESLLGIRASMSIVVRSAPLVGLDLPWSPFGSSSF